MDSAIFWGIFFKEKREGESKCNVGILLFSTTVDTDCHEYLGFGVWKHSVMSGFGQMSLQIRPELVPNTRIITHTVKYILSKNKYITPSRRKRREKNTTIRNEMRK